MTQRFRQLVLTGIFMTMPLMLNAQSSDEVLDPSVLQAVNAELLKNADKAAKELDYSCAVVFSKTADGMPELVAAAYNISDGDATGVAMLSYRPGEARVLDTIKNSKLGFDGGYCDASVENLADPEQPSSLLARTVKISFGGQDWFFLWNGKKLQNITALEPTDSGFPPDSAMHGTYIVDIDHSGAMQVIGNNGDTDRFPDDDGIASTGKGCLFRYDGTTYAQAKLLLALREYWPQPSTWNVTMEGPWISTQHDEIDMHETPEPSYKLTLVNGDRDGRNRTTSAKVELNGHTIISAGEVNKQVETLTRTIQLQQGNTIVVATEGPEKSHVLVVVE